MTWCYITLKCTFLRPHGESICTQEIVSVHLQFVHFRIQIKSFWSVAYLLHSEGKITFLLHFIRLKLFFSTYIHFQRFPECNLFAFIWTAMPLNWCRFNKQSTKFSIVRSLNNVLESVGNSHNLFEETKDYFCQLISLSKTLPLEVTSFI